MSTKRVKNIPVSEKRSIESGNRIRAARKEKDWSQGVLAQKLGKSDRSSISKWESGKASPSIDEFIELARLTGKPISHLMAIDVVRNQVEIEKKLNSVISENQSLADELNSIEPDQDQSVLVLQSIRELIQRYLDASE